MADHNLEDDNIDDDAAARREEREYYAEELKKYPVPSSPFVRAAATGDFDTVRRMIGENVDVNQRDPGFKIDDNWTTRDPREPNTFGSTAFDMAIRTKNLPMMKLLHAAGANPDQPDGGRLQHSGVMLAIAAGFVDGVRFLVDEQRYPLKQPEGKSDAWLLVAAVREPAGRRKPDGDGGLAMLRYLVEEKGIDPALTTENGVSAASAANSEGVPTAIMEYLYSKGAVPFGTQEVKPLLKMSFHPEVAGDLEKMGVGEGKGKRGGLSILADAMDMLDRFGRKSTLLNQSVFHADIEKVRIHLKNGASALVADAQGVNAYHVLEVLKQQPERSLFGYRPEHDAVKALLDESVASRPRRKPAQPKP